jgi:hypothetical protein
MTDFISHFRRHVNQTTFGQFHLESFYIYDLMKIIDKMQNATISPKIQTNTLYRDLSSEIGQIYPSYY